MCAPGGRQPASPPSPWWRPRSPGPTSTRRPRTRTARTRPAGSRAGRAAPASSSGRTARPPPSSPSTPERVSNTRNRTDRTAINPGITATDTRVPTPIRLRASDVDRQQTVHELQDAASRGLLTPDETGERMAAASAAQHVDELRVLRGGLVALAFTGLGEGGGPGGPAGLGGGHRHSAD